MMKNYSTRPTVSKKRVLHGSHFTNTNHPGKIKAGSASSHIHVCYLQQYKRTAASSELMDRKYRMQIFQNNLF